VWNRDFMHRNSRRIVVGAIARFLQVTPTSQQPHNSLTGILTTNLLALQP